jgi:hypothetical protein
MDDEPCLAFQILAMMASLCGFIAMIFLWLREKLIAKAVNAIIDFEAEALVLTDAQRDELSRLEDDRPFPLWAEVVWRPYAVIHACLEEVLRIDDRISYLIWFGVGLPCVVMGLMELARQEVLKPILAVVLMLLFIYWFLCAIEPKAQE